MDSVIDKQEAAVDTEQHVSFLALDDELHSMFAACIGHDGVWRMLQPVKLQMDRVRCLSLPDATPGRVLIEQHRTIVGGLRAKHPDAAEAAMRRPLSEVLASLPRLVAQFPHYLEQHPEMPA